MKVPNTNANFSWPKTEETKRDRDPNFKGETTLYFQIGLIICLLMSYFALEYTSTTYQTDLGKVSPTYDNHELAPKPFKIYKEPEPVVQKPKQQKPPVVLGPNITEVDDKSEQVESKIIEKNTTENYSDLNPNNVVVYKVPEDITIPEAFVHKVPLFPGCEKSLTNEDSKKCFSDKLGKLIQRHFNTGIAEEYGLSGKQNIGVQFKIDTNGNVTEIKTRAPHPELEKEARRVLNKIPKMQPGEQNNKPVNVQYALPINFVIQQ
ncbi:energy transducer TonB [Paucihalobacter sp.]|uniref:energy transducer TonB n=1 Tax=Paucihalobacter sp. TaxID=2850405 RepID=UPI003D161308